jgi:hypothetical protein
MMLLAMMRQAFAAARSGVSNFAQTRPVNCPNVFAYVVLSEIVGSLPILRKCMDYRGDKDAHSQQ